LTNGADEGTPAATVPVGQTSCAAVWPFAALPPQLRWLSHQPDKHYSTAQLSAIAAWISEGTYSQRTGLLLEDANRIAAPPHRPRRTSCNLCPNECHVRSAIASVRRLTLSWPSRRVQTQAPDSASAPNATVPALPPPPSLCPAPRHDCPTAPRGHGAVRGGRRPLTTLRDHPAALSICGRGTLRAAAKVAA
jgi:hypothetical protein